MLAIIVFIFAGAMAASGAHWVATRHAETRGPRLEGITFVSSVLVAAAFGWAIHSLMQFSNVAFSAEAAAKVRRGFPIETAYLLLITGGIYVLSAFRGSMRLPPWIADVLILIAAYVSIDIYTHGAATGRNNPMASFQPLKIILPLFFAMLWMWAMARMTAALNRLPHVTSGYLGLLGLVLWIVVSLDSRISSFFPAGASAALAGAGLCTVPLAIRRDNYNIGWSAALAMGFLIAQIAAVGLIQSTASAVVLLSALAFGVPLLDFAFYRMRALMPGQKNAGVSDTMRLHEALGARGVARGKVVVLYLAIGAWLCLLGVLFGRVFESYIPMWVMAFRLLVVFVIATGGGIIFFSLARVFMRRTEHEIVPAEIEAFGIRISPVNMDGAMARIDGFIQAHRPHHIITCDANAILRVREDPEYAAIVRRAALITPDGYGVLWGARLLNLPIYERVTGVDMVALTCELAARKGYSIFILGSEPGIAATAAAKLQERYPGLTIAGTQHGYYTPEEEPAIVQAIHDTHPDVLFVAFGIPKQEKFIAKYMDDINASVYMGVGGSFDVYSEKLKRAPDAIQRAGLEWLYRVYQEPWRWKRMSYVPRFMLHAIKIWLLGPERHTEAGDTNKPNPA